MEQAMWRVLHHWFEIEVSPLCNCCCFKLVFLSSVIRTGHVDPHIWDVLGVFANKYSKSKCPKVPWDRFRSSFPYPNCHKMTIEIGCVSWFPMFEHTHKLTDGSSKANILLGTNEPDIYGSCMGNMSGSTGTMVNYDQPNSISLICIAETILPRYTYKEAQVFWL